MNASPTSLPAIAGTAIFSNPFQTRPKPPQSFFARVFRRPHLDGFAWAIEEELACRPDWWRTQASELLDVESQFHVRLDKAQTEVRFLLEQAVRALPEAQWLNGAVVAVRELASGLKHPHSADEAILSRSRAVLGAAIARAIQDDELDGNERSQLDALTATLGLEPNEFTRTATDLIGARILSEIKDVLADGMISDEEEGRLNRLAEGLHTRLDLGPDLTETLRQARRLWQIRNGHLPGVPSPLNLQSGEVCHFAGSGEVKELRQQTVRTSVRGTHVRIRIMKGVSYNLGSYSSAPQKQDYYFTFGAGDIVITSKRILFNGGAKNIAIRLSNVVDFVPYTDGVEIRKSSGKPQIFVLEKSDATFAEIFARALREA